MRFKEMVASEVAKIIAAKGVKDDSQESSKTDAAELKETVRKMLADAGITVESAVAKKRVSKDITLRLSDEQKGAIASTNLAEVIKTDEDRRLVYGISNVYSIGGELVKDLDGDSFTTRAMEEFIGDVLKKTGTGKFEHQGDARNEIVQGIVLSDELQKALGIDLGLECLLTCTHVPGDDDWATVKDGTWEQSIAGRFWFYEDADA